MAYSQSGISGSQARIPKLLATAQSLDFTRIKASVKAITNYCLHYNLTPNSELTYWLQFGFPDGMEYIDVTKYTEKKTKKKK